MWFFLSTVGAALADEPTSCHLLVSQADGGARIDAVDLSTGELSTVVAAVDADVASSRGLVVDLERALFCAGNVLWEVSLADGTTAETSTACASVGGGDATVLLSPRGGPSAVYPTAAAAAAGDSASATPYLRRNGAAAVEGDSAAVTTLPGVAVYVYAISTGALTSTLIPEGLNGTIWGLSWADGQLYLVDDGITEEARLEPAIRWYDPDTGRSTGSVGLRLDATDRARGLSCTAP